MSSFSHFLARRIACLGRVVHVCCLSLCLLFGGTAELSAKARQVALIAGPITGHPKDAHEYEKAITLIKHCLDTSANAPEMDVSVHYHGWPEDPSVLDRADAILLVSDGSDHDETMHPFYRDDRYAILKRQMERGCGLMLLHWSTFHPSRYHEDITEWVGGYFDYETGSGPRKWFSKISTWEDTVQLASPAHPVLKGVSPFRLKDEYYYHLKFREADPRVQPILKVVPPGTEQADTVAWAVERRQGARGFGFSGGHFHDSWWIPGFRKMLLNAVAWTAGAVIPEGGIESRLEPRFKAMILTGHQHPAHPWKDTTAALIHAIELDPRSVVHVTETPETWLRSEAVKDYDLIVLNYCNWERPGWHASSQSNLDAFVRQGGGLVVVHFSNGAFHRSLPGAEASDWPGYRQLVRRVWDHDGGSAHDPFGAFTVHISSVDHPVTRGLSGFETVDELYHHQVGDAPIQALAWGLSKQTGRPEPLAWTYQVGLGRVFQTVLGHDAGSIRMAGNLIQRGATWTARRVPLALDPPVRITENAMFRNGSQWKP